MSPITQRLLMLEVKGDDDKWPRDKVKRDDDVGPKAVKQPGKKKIKLNLEQCYIGASIV